MMPNRKRITRTERAVQIVKEAMQKIREWQQKRQQQLEAEMKLDDLTDLAPNSMGNKISNAKEKWKTQLNNSPLFEPLLVEEKRK